jgi:hypothetical protein
MIATQVLPTSVDARAFLAAADPTASATQEGIIELATQAEVASLDATRAVTPATLRVALHAVALCF